MGLLDQRYIMGVFFPHILVPCSQILNKLRRLLFLTSLVFVFAGLLAYSYIFYSPCDGIHYSTPLGTTDLDGFIFLAYIGLGGWGMELYQTALDETTWIFVWHRLFAKPTRRPKSSLTLERLYVVETPSSVFWHSSKPSGNCPGKIASSKSVAISAPLSFLRDLFCSTLSEIQTSSEHQGYVHSTSLIGSLLAFSSALRSFRYLWPPSCSSSPSFHHSPLTPQQRVLTRFSSRLDQVDLQQRINST